MTNEEVERLEKSFGQLEGLYKEISLLAKRSPSDAVNLFKLNLVNKVLASANEILGEKYLPVNGFTAFDHDDVPSTSDVALVLSQYIEEMERFRSDNITQVYNHWYYIVDGMTSDRRTRPPGKVSK